MKVSYRRSTGKQLEYTIDADRHGNYRIHLGEKLLFSWGEPEGFGTPRWGSKAKQALAIEAARTAIEELRGMQEE